MAIVHKVWGSVLALSMSIAGGCATTQGDPLRNTRKLVAEGHASLYNNGAFQVPNTSVRLISPAPETTQLVGELMGVHALQSMELSLKRAAESVQVVAEGTKTTYHRGQNIHEGADAGARAIHDLARENSTVLVYRSTELGKSIAGKSWDTSKRMMREGIQTGVGIIPESRRAGNELEEKGAARRSWILAGSRQTAERLSGESVSRSGDAFSLAGGAFVKGYAAVPANVRKRVSATGETLDKMNPINIVGVENDRRKKMSMVAVDLMNRTVRNYGKEVGGSFEKAGKEKEMGDYRTTGLPPSVLKSMRWVLKGLLLDATIEPVTRLTAASLGYIGVNFVAFPTMVVVREGVATTQLALQVTWNTARTEVDIVAPTGIAALAGVFGVADVAGSNIAAGATAAGGAAAGYGSKATSSVAGVMVKGGGYAAGKGVQYIGVPLASAGIAMGGGTIGTAIGTAGAAASGALFVTGETAAAGTFAFGNVIAGTTMVGGAAASTAGGAAYGVYELSKAFAVPAGYELGGGMVLSYEAASKIAAHSILAASECAYLVLSLEGPRWVIYAIKGKTHDGSDLPAGAVVDLNQMQLQGEDIYNLPVSNEDMKKVVETMYESLPEVSGEGSQTAEAKDGGKP